MQKAFDFILMQKYFKDRLRLEALPRTITFFVIRLIKDWIRMETIATIKPSFEGFLLIFSISTGLTVSVVWGCTMGYVWNTSAKLAVPFF